MKNIETLNNINRQNYKSFLGKTIIALQEQKSGKIVQIEYTVDNIRDEEYKSKKTPNIPIFELTQVGNNKKRILMLWNIKN
jgi:ABC-type oligopeptide transport system ATPase subunit